MRRRGFTLVELLVVITIIAILLTLTIRVVGSVITVSRESATQTTIRKVQALLNSRAEAMSRSQLSKAYIRNTPEWIMTEGLTTDDATKKAMVAKLLARRHLPQRFQEVLDGDAINAKLNLPPAHPNITNAGAASSSEILYDVLTQSDVLGDVSIGTDSFGSNQVGDPDKNGLPEFIDGWGQPLRFYRWPTRLFRPTGTPTQNDVTSGIDLTNAKILLSQLPTFTGNIVNDLCRDPDDPIRRCMSVANFATIGVPVSVHWNLPISGPVFHTPATYHVMLVVSAGADKMLGLYEPDDVAHEGHLGKVRDANDLADDITYLNVRAGGR